MSIMETKQETVTFWQEPTADDGCAIGELAIVMTIYSDVVEMRQGKRFIQVTNACLDEFIKAIRQAKKFAAILDVTR